MRSSWSYGRKYVALPASVCSRQMKPRPRAIFLDLVLPDTDGFTILDALKADPRTREIPVFVHTSKRLTDADRSRLQTAAGIVPKESESREAALAAVRKALLETGLAPLPPETTA